MAPLAGGGAGGGLGVGQGAEPNTWRHRTHQETGGNSNKVNRISGVAFKSKLTHEDSSLERYRSQK